MTDPLKTPEIIPSLFAADPLRYCDALKAVERSECRRIHLDIMDGHFVPNLSYGPDMVREIHAAFPELKLDVHLMMDHPEEYIQRFAQGAWNITVHEEIEADLSELLDRIHECGVHTGISLKPATPVSRVVPFLSQADMILIMTVEPGFGGQSFQREMLGKLRELRRIGYQGLLEADGGLTLNNLPDLKQAGLDVAVMGTAIYRSEHPADDIRSIHSL